MSTCCWCTPGGSEAIQLLRRYASATLEFTAANDDLCYCLECVDEYHKARDELPSLHEVLWELETNRLVAHFEKSLKEDGEDDDLYIVEEDRETPLCCFTGPGFEKHLRVPLLEILKYPYLLLHEHVSELCVEALCKMEQINYSYQVVGKHPGIYLLMVHPNEMIRRWAILTARSLGKVDRDDYYDIQEVLTCLFKVIELGLFENPDIYHSSVFKKGKLILLPSHLYDTTNYKNYWLGICMLLTVLEEQAMDSLLLGPDKQNDFMQSIMNIMKKETDDESNNPFWPALHCFMVILDKLGSKVWGQLIDPIQAFQTIINNASYKKEIENVRTSCRRTKSEPLSDYGDEMVTCSQIVYNYNPERPNKDTGWRTAVCPDYCSNLYEDMQTLTDMLQCDILRDMRLHNSTFLWFIPFVHSLMDLKDMGVAYSVVVIHHLCSEIKDTLNDTAQSCDKVSEFFIWILVSIVELSFKKNGLHLLWVSSETWVEVVVKCASLPSVVFLRGFDRGVSRNCSRSTAGMPSLEPESVQWACMNLIRNILKEGYQVGQKNTQFLDELNLLRRSREAWKLSPQQAKELQKCLKLILSRICNKSLNSSSHRDFPAVCSPPTSLSIKQEKFPVNPHHELPSYLSPRGREDVCDDGSSPRRSCNWAEEASSKDQNLQGPLVCHLTNIKQEPKDNLTQAHNNMSSLFANGQMGGQKNGSCCQELEGQSTQGAAHITGLSNQSFHHLETKGVNGKKKSSRTSKDLAEKDHHDKKGSSTSEIQMGLNNLMNNNRLKKSDFTLKLKLLVENKKRENTNLGPAAEKQQSDKGGDKSQERQKDRVVRSGSSVSLGKSRTVSDEAQEGQPLSVKQESKDRVVEFRNTLGAEEDAEESSSDDEMANVPLSLIRKDLVRKKAASVTSPVTESEIDKDLSKPSLAAYTKATSFPADSSQEDTTYCQDRIKRKVQGALRTWSDRENNKSSSDVDEPPVQVIIISDTSSDEDENKVDVVRKSKKEKTDEYPEKPSTSAPGQETMATSSNSPLLYADYESQCFEFETEDDIYSVWENSQMNENTETKSPPSKTTCSPALPDLGVAKQLSDCGYDTDYLGDEITEKAADDLEQQVKQKQTKPHMPATEGFSKQTSEPPSRCFTEMQADDGGCSKHTDPFLPGISTSTGLSSSTSVVKKSTIEPGKSLAKSCQFKTANRSPVKRGSKSNAHSRKSPPAATSLSTPAVVPPNKVHKFPGPTLLTEKLGLTKKIRRAAELSQRTQDSITKLREYGKTAGELPQKRKAKLIKPQHLMDRNKKMLTCQDRYLLSHRRQKEIERGQRANSRNKTAKKTPPKRCSESAGSTLVIDNQKEKATEASHSSSSERKQLRQSSVETERVQSASISLVKEFPLTRQESISAHTNIQEIASPVPGNLCPLVTGSSKTDPTAMSSGTASLSDEGVASKDGVSELNEKIIGEDDGLFLTQKDPVDMELCSQMENDVPSPGLPQNPLQDDTLGFPKCKRAGCTRKGEGAAGYCEEHSAHDQPDHLFAKPFPPVKLSTTKIFSSNSSRTANLTKELETITKAPAASKSKPIPIRPPASDGLKLRTPTLKSILQPQNPNNITQLQNGQSSHGSYNSRMLPTVRVGSRQDTRSSFPQLNGSVQHRDHSIFIKEVLKWSYDMFANINQLGPPDHLLRSVVASVPVKFQDYNDYFNTLFPLTMLNAFEEVAQEWLENQKAKEQKPLCLNLLNFNANLNKADFTANVSQSDLDKQLHPKEDDLVFLKASEKRSYCEEDETESHLVRFVGLVTRFSHPTIRDSKRKEHQVVCHLSIQTQGNLSRVDKQVRCVVVSSLVTTQRQFRALLLLNRSPLAKPIISPSYSDFCPQVLNTDSERYISRSREFNEEQRRAIEVACAMVTQHPSVPKICLIHGPPGTGKSKTIVGLLHRILSERSGKENPVQSLNAKIKRNRVLVCAPSNAAVDDLMKKIILEFKEKCQDKNNPLGNCGDINLVRLGQQKSISKDVRKFSLNDQIDHRINRATLGKDQNLQKSKEDLDRQLDMLSRQRAMDRSEKREKKQQLDEEICRLSKERQRLASQLKEVHGRSQELKASIILESHILCCTLSTSGGVLLESAFRRLGGDPVSCVIVDEAGQTCEVETLIPLIHGCKKLVLVGDPKQLPPTVKSVRAQNYGYDQSLMGRLCRHLQEQVQENVMGRLPVLQLTTQYRMHPEICLFPSKYIYGHSLKTDRQTAENRFSLEWPFQPYLLFDVLDGKEERDSDSYANPQEVRLVIELMKLIKEKRRDIGYRHIGIITPYSAQKRRIRKQLDREFGENSASEVDTVDGFQGREKDCIIVTCVRANSTQGSIGFLRSLQRLNVTITRAKYSLFILGKLKTLMESKDWNELIQDAQKRGNIIQTSSSSYKSCALKILKSRPLSNLGIPVPKRAPLGHTDTTRREQNETPNRVSQPTPANSGASTERSTGAQHLSMLHESSSSGPLPPQARPVEERPKDPRLARRSEPTLQVGTCKLGHLSGSSGGESPQSPDAPLTHWNQNHAVHQLSSNAETTGNLISNAYTAAMAVPAKLPGPYAPKRVCLSVDEAKTLGQGGHPAPQEPSQEKDCHSRGRRVSRADSPDTSDTKRRRTTC